MAIVDRPTELSEQMLESVEKGQRAAIEAVRNFVDTVDEKPNPGAVALPRHSLRMHRRPLVGVSVTQCPPNLNREIPCRESS